MTETQQINHAPKKLVLSLIKGINEDKKRVQSINGTRGEEIRGYVEDKHLHAKALKRVAELVRMDQEKRDDFLRAQARYCEYAKEAGLFGDEHTGDLVEQAENGELISLGDVMAQNVARLRVGINQAPEQDA